jgi:hypothetical protein
MGKEFLKYDRLGNHQNLGLARKHLDTGHYSQEQRRSNACFVLGMDEAPGADGWITDSIWKGEWEIGSIVSSNADI